MKRMQVFQTNNNLLMMMTASAAIIVTNVRVNVERSSTIGSVSGALTDADMMCSSFHTI
jgi:uncharacterized transporter YbjL